MSLSQLAKTEISLPRPRRRAPGDAPRRRGRRSGDRRPVVGLDIQPGEVVAAQVRLDGGVVSVERAVAAELDHGLVRDGEVVDAEALGARLKELFAEHRLPTTVRIGLASPRAVMRIIDLPPLTDAGDLAAAVRIQAPEHIAMPVDRAVLDHRLLGAVQTPAGPRSRVLVAAARRESVQRVLEAVRCAGLRAEGIDLSAFALTRALRAAGAGADAPPVLYAHVSGVTTVAIARGPVCELARVAPVGLEELSSRLAEREGIPVAVARTRLVSFEAEGDVDEPALAVLDAGLAELAGDLGKTLEFHAAQSDGAPVAETVISGTAALIPNFPEVLGQRMQAPVRRGAPAELNPGAAGEVALERAAVAAGLAVEEVPA